MSDIYGTDSTGKEFVDGTARVAAEIEGFAAEVDREARFPEEAIGLLADRGFFGLCLPREVGGCAQPPAVLAGVVEQLAKVCSSTAMIYVMHVAGAQTFAAAPETPQRDALLREVVAGKHLTTLAFSERGSRSQFWAPVSKLRDSGDEGYRVSASKSWITSANHADSYVASAQSPDADSPLESTLYLARRGIGGIKVAGHFDGLGLRGNDSAPVEITDHCVHENDLLTRHGAGAAVMLEIVLPWFSVGTAAMAHGLCMAAIAATQSHLCDQGFAHDGKKLRDLPNLRTRLADMSCRTAQSRALLGFATRSMSEPDEQTTLYVLQARMSALEAAVSVTDLAMKACGGAAFSHHLGVERMFRDARAGWVMAPTVDHLQDFVGRALTGMPLF